MQTDSEMLNTIATKRKTVRRYKPDIPPIEDIYKVLDTVRQAPSGSNKQPWRFLVVDDPSVKSMIRKAAETGEKVFYASISEEHRKMYNAMGNSWKKPMLEQAPYLIVVVSDTTAPNYHPSAWLAIGYLVLTLEAVGLNSVTYTASDSKLIHSALEIPDKYRLETILPVGYSNDPKEKLPRKKLKELIYKNNWGVFADIS